MRSDVCPPGQVDHREGPLAALVTGAPAYATRFCAWSGASGTRYIATIFAISDDPPDIDGCVLMAIRAGRTRCVLDALVVERREDWRRAILAARAAGATEWHVHMLASDRRARLSAVADLRARHCPAEEVALCA